MIDLLLMDGINWGHVLDGFLSDGMNWGMAYAGVLGLVAILLVATMLVWQLLDSNHDSSNREESSDESLQFR